MKRISLILIIFTLFLTACLRQSEDILVEISIFPRYLISRQEKILVAGEDKVDLKTWKIFLIEEGNTQNLMAFSWFPQEFGLISNNLYVIGEETFLFDLEKRKKLDLKIPEGVPLKIIVLENQLVLQYPALLLIITEEGIVEVKIPEELFLINYNEQGMFFQDLRGSVFFVEKDLSIITEISIPPQKDERLYLLGLQPFSGFASTSRGRTHIYLSDGDKLKNMELDDQISKIVYFEGKLILLGNKISSLEKDGTLKQISSVKPDHILVGLSVGESRIAILYSDKLTRDCLILTLDTSMKVRIRSLKDKYLSIAINNNRILLGKNNGIIVSIP